MRDLVECFCEVQEDHVDPVLVCQRAGNDVERFEKVRNTSFIPNKSVLFFRYKIFRIQVLKDRVAYNTFKNLASERVK